MRRPRISFIVHDLAANPIARALPLASAVREEYEVEILGLLLSGDAVYAPYRDAFPFRTLRCSALLPAMIAGVARLSRMATGDVLFACKPLIGTLGAALLAPGARRVRPVLLDIEDDEWSATATSPSDRRLPEWLKGWLFGTHAGYARLAHPLTRLVQGVTVSSRKLQERYGGTLIRHGPDVGDFDPARTDLSDAPQLRRRLGLPLSRKLALFAGVPRPHKGMDLLLDALDRPEAAAWDLVLGGSYEYPAFARARARLGARCHVLGPVSHDAMPALLASVDAVPVPQRPGPYAEAQLPAKALEAMAMGVPVVGSRVGDLPEILGDGSRGWLVQPEDPAGIAAALAQIAAEPDLARRRSRQARSWYLSEASSDSIRERLLAVVERALRETGALTTSRFVRQSA